MKLSKKLRLFLSLISLLVCVCMGGIVVSADVMDMPIEETTTTEDDTVLYAEGKLSLADAKSMIQSYTEQIASVSVLSKEELLYLDQMYQSQTDFYGSYAKAAGEAGFGSYIGYGNVDVIETEEDGVLKIKSELQFSENNVILTLNVQCFENLGAVVTSTEFSVVDDTDQSIGGKLKGAGMNTIVGMGTVFVVLILISLIISCFNFIPKIQAMFSKKEEEAQETDTKSEIPVAVSKSNDVKADDLELIAVISAAIAASENTTTDSFVVRSIRKR